MSLLEEKNRAGSSKELGVYSVARCQKYRTLLTGSQHGNYIAMAKVPFHLNVHGSIQTIGNWSDAFRYVNPGSTPASTQLKRQLTALELRRVAYGTAVSFVTRPPLTHLGSPAASLDSL
ncbi:hypothetical protein PCH_Pc21g19850 [Penicillium rubens Wisconsin 54-1255]|uniref:Uncharacterized protein n=1 Tax=Penicillium rubens (strain ATCC 28089 / DSM 1075 / NRRL 1951 / Wisconsin 54-1255) TaxID=500485 RepID=B6HJY3_PENRW|nr:hypothetical protein PCH_Pc21g19850 [Penicillium rubens Wisconsin 54-1255]